jgi:hypothetical protein
MSTPQIPQKNSRSSANPDQRETNKEPQLVFNGNGGLGIYGQHNTVNVNNYYQRCGNIRIFNSYKTEIIL